MGCLTALGRDRREIMRELEVELACAERCRDGVESPADRERWKREADWLRYQITLQRIELAKGGVQR